MNIPNSGRLHRNCLEVSVCFCFLPLFTLSLHPVIPLSHSLSPSAGGRVCAPSPHVLSRCRRHEALADDGFEAISTLEVLLKVHACAPSCSPYQTLVLTGPWRSPPTPQSLATPLFSKTTMPPVEMAVHTGYLTFATKPRV